MLDGVRSAAEHGFYQIRSFMFWSPEGATVPISQRAMRFLPADGRGVLGSGEDLIKKTRLDRKSLWFFWVSYHVFDVSFVALPRMHYSAEQKLSGQSVSVKKDDFNFLLHFLPGR